MATGKQKADSKRRATQHRVADAHYIITKFIPLPLLIPVTAKKNVNCCKFNANTARSCIRQ